MPLTSINDGSIWARALYSYEATSSEELSFEEGELIRILRKVRKFLPLRCDPCFKQRFQICEVLKCVAQFWVRWTRHVSLKLLLQILLEGKESALRALHCGLNGLAVVLPPSNNEN